MADPLAAETANLQTEYPLDFENADPHPTAVDNFDDSDDDSEDPTGKPVGTAKSPVSKQVFVPFPTKPTKRVIRGGNMGPSTTIRYTKGAKRVDIA